MIKGVELLDLNQLKREAEGLPKGSILKVLVERLLEEAMKQEREEFLTLSKNNSSNKANGYYTRSLIWGSNTLKVNVPRDRRGQFRSVFLPEYYERSIDENYERIIASLVSNGYSKTKLLNFLRSLKLPYNRRSLERIVNRIHKAALAFKNRQLPERAIALYIDGYHTSIKDSEGKVVKVVIYTALGIDFQLKKDIYGWWVIKGSESKEKWKEVFKELIERGLKKISIIISDNLAGIKEVVKAFYPKANHQLCLVHLARNIRKSMQREDAKELIEKLTQMRKKDLEFKKGKEILKEQLKAYKGKYRRFIESVEKDLNNYLSFLKYPTKVKKYFYSTNPIENFNSVIERQVKSISGYFPSKRFLDINIYLARERLIKKRWRSGIPALKGVIYELTQIFNIQYFEEEEK